MPEPMNQPLEVKTTLSHYRIVSKLGGMGEVSQICPL